jgi:methionyl-tRNA formyltransferase
VRYVFLGSPPFATPVLEHLLEVRPPTLVVTPPERPRGRGRRVEPSPVAALAREAGVPLLQPESVRDAAFLEELRGHEAEVFLVVSYGELLRQEFLDLPTTVCLNVHPSLLPRHRGATPIQAALLAGDERTGVSIQQVVLALDAGDVLVARETEVRAGETAGELAGRLSVLSGEAAAEALELVASGRAVYTPQDEAAVTVCKKLEKEDGRIDWSESAEAIERRVRAMNPWPLAHTTGPAGQKLALHRAEVLPVESESPPGTLLSAKERLIVACGEGALDVVQIQAAGKRVMSAPDFLRGARLTEGDLLGAAR